MTILTIQINRGSGTPATGLPGEPIFDSNAKRLYVCDLVDETLFHLIGGAGNQRTITSITDTYTVDSGDELDDLIFCTKATAFTVTFPAISAMEGRVLTFKNLGVGVVTLDPDGSETIDGETTITLSQYESVTLGTNGSVWGIL